MAVGEFANHLVIDSAVFGLPLLYNKQLPDLHKLQERHHTNDAPIVGHTEQDGLATVPNPIPIGFT